MLDEKYETFSHGYQFCLYNFLDALYQINFDLISVWMLCDEYATPNESFHSISYANQSLLFESLTTLVLFADRTARRKRRIYFMASPRTKTISYRHFLTLWHLSRSLNF